jgi:hypothetical protein
MSVVSRTPEAVGLNDTVDASDEVSVEVESDAVVAVAAAEAVVEVVSVVVLAVAEQPAASKQNALKSAIDFRLYIYFLHVFRRCYFYMAM